MTKKLTAAGRISQARARLMLKHPWFGTLAMRLGIVEQPGLATMATDGTSIIYDPKFVDSLSDSHLMTIVAHEVCHCAFRHMYRIGARKMDDWNDAADFAVNPELKRSGMPLPEGALYEQRFEGMNAEMIYAIRDQEKQQEQAQQPQPQQQPQQAGKSGDNGGQPQQQPGDESDEQSDDQGQQPQAGKGKPNPMGKFVPPQTPQKDESQSEGQSGGQPDQQQPQPGQQGQPQPQLASDPLTEADWEIACEQATAMTRGAGKLPLGMDRAVAAAKEAAVDWKAVLWRFVEQQIASDYSWSRPNRRFVHAGLYLPGVVKENMARFAIGNDTSGSVSNAYQALVAAELTQVMRELRPAGLEVFHCDSAVQLIESLDPEDQEIKLNARGGGGTCFRPVFDAIAAHENTQDYKAIIFFTEDLEASDWNVCIPPEIPVLWVVPETCRRTAPFGETVKVSKY